MGNPGSPWTIQRALRDARDKLDLPDDFRFHDLRHYFASLLIASGLDVKVVQARLRHASAKTTLDTYGHLWPDRDKHLTRRCRGGLQGKGTTMGFYEPGIGVDSFEPDPDGLLRIRRYEVEEAYDIGDIVSIDDDEIMGFARVVRFEGDPATGWICLGQLVGEEADQAAVDLELSYDDWCDPRT